MRGSGRPAEVTCRAPAPSVGNAVSRTARFTPTAGSASNSTPRTAGGSRTSPFPGQPLRRWPTRSSSERWRPPGGRRRGEAGEREDDRRPSAVVREVPRRRLPFHLEGQEVVDPLVAWPVRGPAGGPAPGGEIEEALLELRKTRKEATVAGYLGVLRPALRRGLGDGHIGSDPTLRLSVSFGYPERHVVWLDEELRRGWRLCAGMVLEPPLLPPCVRAPDRRRPHPALGSGRGWASEAPARAGEDGRAAGRSSSGRPWPSSRGFRGPVRSFSPGRGRAPGPTTVSSG